MLNLCMEALKQGRRPVEAALKFSQRNNPYCELLSFTILPTEDKRKRWQTAI